MTVLCNCRAKEFFSPVLFDKRIHDEKSLVCRVIDVLTAVSVLYHYITECQASCAFWDGWGIGYWVLGSVGSG